MVFSVYWLWRLRVKKNPEFAFNIVCQNTCIYLNSNIHLKNLEGAYINLLLRNRSNTLKKLNNGSLLMSDRFNNENFLQNGDLNAWNKLFIITYWLIYTVLIYLSHILIKSLRLSGILWSCMYMYVHVLFMAHSNNKMIPPNSFLRNS